MARTCVFVFLSNLSDLQTQYSERRTNESAMIVLRPAAIVEVVRMGLIFSGCQTSERECLRFGRGGFSSGPVFVKPVRRGGSSFGALC